MDIPVLSVSLSLSICVLKKIGGLLSEGKSC